MSILKKLRPPSRQQREKLLALIERRTELPLLIMAFLMIPLVAGPFIWELSAGDRAIFGSLNLLIWVAFAVDLGIKLVVAPNPFKYARVHWLDVLIVLIPFLRPLRIVRLFFRRGASRRLSQIDFLLAYGFGAVITATTIIVAFEKRADGPLSEFATALWWAVVTVTTVGYGDVTPVTVGGRVIAGLLMVIGIGLFSALTANVASKFVQSDTDDETLADSTKLDAILAKIEQLELQVSRIENRT